MLLYRGFDVVVGVEDAMGEEDALREEEALEDEDVLGVEEKALGGGVMGEVRSSSRLFME